MGTELRKREVPPWEVSGMLGHKSAGYRTTEIYAKFDPNYLDKAIAAIDTYFGELQEKVERRLILPEQRHLRVTCVSVEEDAPMRLRKCLFLW